MNGLVRSLFVGGLTVAIAGAGLFGGVVALAATSVAPTAVTVAVSPTAIVEGDTVTLTVTLNAVATEQLGVQVTWGDSTADGFAFISPGQTKLDFTHLYVDNAPKGTPQGSLTISVRADNVTTSLTGSTSVLIRNAAPTFTSLVVSPSTITAGTRATVTGVFADVGKADRHRVMVDWGDWSTTMFPLLAFKQYDFAYSHVYAFPGFYTITPRVTDDDTGWVEASVQLTVTAASTNVPPTNLVLSAPAVVQGSSTTLTGTFTDPDAADTHTVVVTWGDGTPTATLSLAAGVTSFTATHPYANAGTWTVAATVTDRAGASTSATTSAVVTVPTAADLLDRMSGLVRSFALDRTTERWLLRRVDLLKASLASGPHEFCEALGDLDRFWTVARRVLTSEQLTALSDLMTKVHATARCGDAGQQGTAIVPNPPVTVAPNAEEREGPNHDGQKNDHDKASGPQQKNGTDSGRADSAKGVRHFQADN
jgi:hypothetical protein